MVPRLPTNRTGKRRRQIRRRQFLLRRRQQAHRSRKRAPATASRRSARWTCRLRWSPSPARSEGLGWALASLDRIWPGAEGEEHQQPAGNGEVLLKVQHLVAVGQVGVEQHGGENREDAEPYAREPCLPTDGEQEGAAKLDEDRQRQQGRGPRKSLHIGDGKVVASDLARSLEQK